MRAIADARIPFYDRSHSAVAFLNVTPCRDVVPGQPFPLVERSESGTNKFGESIVQLCESERYEYEIESFGRDLRLRCSLATRRRNLRPGSTDSGLIETRSFCGSLLLELVEGDVALGKDPIATAIVDVRSIKLDYRTEYRGMLRRITDEMCGLAVDARSSAKVKLHSTFARREDVGWLQVQVELMREVLDSDEFNAAIHRIITFPHERVSTRQAESKSVSVSKWSPLLVRQLVGRAPRRLLPSNHPLTKLGLESVAESVLIETKSRSVDTPENRFVKFALIEFREFLTAALSVFSLSRGWEVAESLSQRLVIKLDQQLSHGFFQEIGQPDIVPFGSPVLQRRAGYRQLYRWWLRLRTASEISWSGGEDLFYAGQRDVASLYEYWIFFELLSWFCRTFRNQQRPKLDEMLDGLDTGSPNLRLKKNVELGPFDGSIAHKGRKLKARFAYNRSFPVTHERWKSGSWTRCLHPDYTLTFWPDELTEEEAEAREQLVHVHFDAKYRLEHLDELFGREDEGFEDNAANYKREDLLKMHAYKDAIKRSHGAYVLYPGRNSESITFKGFHEVLPGLGAFGISPNEDGTANGINALESFLGEVLQHLSNQTTAQERLSYHVAESYSVYEPPIDYGFLSLREHDVISDEHRAIPPAEHMVLIAWYRNDEQLDLARAIDGLYFVRLGRRSGALHVHPNLSLVRNVLLHTANVNFAPGLLRLREPGFRIFTRTQLRRELERLANLRVANWQTIVSKDDDEHIYALFKTTVDESFETQFWRGDALLGLLAKFESDARNRPIVNVGRLSAYPRVLPLREVLKLRA